MTPPVHEVRALVLAGGLGTRLRSVLGEVPKVLAPVGEHTFLDLFLGGLRSRGLRRFVLLLGHRHELVEEHLARAVRPRWPELEIETSVEGEARGTAGALKLAAPFCSRTFLLLNGDTWAELDPATLLAHHAATAADVTIAARQVDDAARFGTIDASPDGVVRAFREKTPSPRPGLVSAGVYAMEPAVLEAIPPDTAVSLEQETFPALLARGSRLVTAPLAGAFVDVGTPESYRAFRDLQRKVTP